MKTLPKNFSTGFLTATSNISKRNLIAINPTYFGNSLTTTEIHSPQKIKTIKISPRVDFRKINNTNLKIKRPNNIKSAKIYLRLEEKDEIEKIISEEEKKKYFNQELHLTKNINRDELKRRLKAKIPFYEISNKKSTKSRNNLLNKEKPKTPKTALEKSTFDRSRNLISVNKKLFKNFRSQGDKEIERSKKSLNMVNDFLKKMDEEKLKKFNEMEKEFLKNKFGNEEQEQIKENNIKDKKNNIKQFENLKITESDFIKFKKRQMIKDKKFLKQKARIFDNALKYDFGNYYAPKTEDNKHYGVNYRLLSRTILMRNLMKQMKVTVFKDESLNVLRGFQSLKIANLENDKLKLDNQDIYSNQNENVFFFGSNMKKKPIPHFLKSKFSKKTINKFGEVVGSYFGLPV